MTEPYNEMLAAKSLHIMRLQREVRLLNRALGRANRRLSKTRERMHQLTQLTRVHDMLLDSTRQALGISADSRTNILTAIEELRTSAREARCANNVDSETRAFGSAP